MDKFAIHRASEAGDLERVRQLIERGVSVNSCDSEGRTPLHWAARQGRLAVVDLLISSKCDLNVKDSDGCTPVFLASRTADTTVVDLLLQSGAQVNCADDRKWTLLHQVSWMGWTDQVKYILDRGEADLNAADRHGYTPLLTAARMVHNDVLVLLIRAGADVNRSDTELKRTALHWAVDYGSTQMVQELLEEEGLDLNPRDECGDTPLHFACDRKREMIKQLLVAGADTTVENNEFETALCGGLRWSNLTLEDIRLLVQHGAFLQHWDYHRISLDPVLKESVLKDVGLCTQSIVNKFHHQSLPTLKSISYFASKLPNVDKFKLNARQVAEVENLVRCEIGRNTFCNVVKARPMALSALCVLSLITCQSGTKQSAFSRFR